MNCRESDILLQTLLDGDAVAPNAELERHLAECARCRDFVQAVPLLETGLRAWSIPAPSSLLTANIVRQVVADRRHRRIRRFAAWAVPAAAAAAVVAAVLVLPLFRNSTRVADRNPPKRQPAVKVEPGSKIPSLPPESLQAKVEKAGSAFAALTNRLADDTRVKAGLLWQAAPLDVAPMATAPDTDALDAKFDPAAKSLQTTGAAVSTSLQTVAHSAQRAVRFFVREMPRLNKNKTIQ